MAELQELQTELEENETIQQHRRAQTELVELLQETNDVINESIGLEFASRQEVSAVEQLRSQDAGDDCY